MVRVAIYEHLKVPSPAQNENFAPLLIAVSSDRGLCGSIHSSISKLVKKSVKDTIREMPNSSPAVLVLGDKAKPQIAREARSYITGHFNQLGRVIPVFLDASNIVDTLEKEFPIKPSVIKIFYNHFKSVIAFESSEITALRADSLLSIGWSIQVTFRRH